MRIKDIIIESVLDEAISISSLYEPVKKAIETGIQNSIGSLYALKGGYPKLEEKFNNGLNSREMMVELIRMAEGPDSRWNMADHIAMEIRKTLTIELGRNVVRGLTFVDLGDTTHGEALLNLKILINSKIVNNIAKASVTKVMNMVLDNYGEGERTGGLWFIIKSIGNGDRHYVSYLLEDNEKRINSITSTLIHEVVHVLQYTPQNTAGRHEDDYEYRSYLGKKDELSKLNAKRKRTRKEKSRYDKLYYASPQEIAAFSHEIAVKMANDLGLRGSRNIEELNRAASAINAQSIIDHVKEITGSYIMPQERKEFPVFKRYGKLVYQELMRYIDKQRERLQAK
jgi:hypothetical protein